VNTTFPIEATRHASVLADAIEDFRPAIAAWRQGEGWATLETRFMGMDHRAGELTLQCTGSDEDTQDICDGQHVSVSFRRGRGRCTFDTVVLGRSRATLSGGQTVSILRLEYPEELCDLQRRGYYRQSVPATAKIEVSLSRVSDQVCTNDAGGAVGSLLDISADGMSVALPQGVGLSVATDDLVDCSIRVDGGASPICLRARVCSRGDLGDGRLRLGLQLINTGPHAAAANREFAHLLARVRT
jgi:c-di-GMP-binding flagellar brake protein YcgR